LTLQRCWAAAWAMGLDGHLLFRHCFRGTLSRKIFCKSTKTSTPWIVLAGGAPLHCKYFKSSVSLPFTIQKVLASPVKKIWCNTSSIHGISSNLSPKKRLLSRTQEKTFARSHVVTPAAFVINIPPWTFRSTLMYVKYIHISWG
jgi:hypothetical protein